MLAPARLARRLLGNTKRAERAGVCRLCGWALASGAPQSAVRDAGAAGDAAGTRARLSRAARATSKLPRGDRAEPAGVRSSRAARARSRGRPRAGLGVQWYAAR